MTHVTMVINMKDTLLLLTTMRSAYKSTVPHNNDWERGQNAVMA